MRDELLLNRIVLAWLYQAGWLSSVGHGSALVHIEVFTDRVVLNCVIMLV